MQKGSDKKLDRGCLGFFQPWIGLCFSSTHFASCPDHIFDSRDWRLIACSVLSQVYKEINVYRNLNQLVNKTLSRLVRSWFLSSADGGCKGLSVVSAKPSWPRHRAAVGGGVVVTERKIPLAMCNAPR